MSILKNKEGRRAARARPSPVAILAASVAIVGANSLVLSPLAGTVGADLGTSAAAVLTATASFGAGTGLSALVLTPWADRIGLARALVLAQAGLAVALALSALAPSVAVLALAQTVAGITAGIALPAIYGLAAALAPPGRTAETMGRVLTGWVLSLVFGVAASALLADLVDWRLIYAGMSALAAGLALLARRLPPTPGQTSVAPHLLRRAEVRVALGNVLCFMAAFYGLWAYIGPHITETLGRSTTTAGLTALIYGAGFAGAAPLDRVIDRVGAARAAPPVFGVLACVYLALAATAGQLAALLATCLAWGAVNHLGLNLLVGRLTALAPDRRGAIMGLNTATTYLAMFAATLAYRPLFQWAGFAPLALVGSALVGSAAWRLWRGRAAGI